MSDKKKFDGIEIGALWRNERGTLTGKMNLSKLPPGVDLNGARIMFSPNTFKKDGEKTPDSRIYFLPERDAPPPPAREPGSDDEPNF